MKLIIGITFITVGIIDRKSFFSKENYLYFIRKIRKQIIPYSHVIAYCLMPNHFHLLLDVKPTDTQITNSRQHPLTNGIAVVLRSYAQAINNQENRTGALFRTRTKAKDLSNGRQNYALTCYHYIHQNPLEAGIAKSMEDWSFSSYRDFAGLRNGSLPSKDIAFDAFSIKDENHFIECSQKTLDPERVKKIF